MAKDDVIIIQEARDTVDEGRLSAIGKCQFAFTDRSSTVREIYLSTTRKDSEFETIPGWRRTFSSTHVSRFIVAHVSRETLVQQIRQIFEPKGLKVEVNLL